MWMGLLQYDKSLTPLDLGLLIKLFQPVAIEFIVKPKLDIIWVKFEDSNLLRYQSILDGLEPALMPVKVDRKHAT